MATYSFTRLSSGMVECDLGGNVVYIPGIAKVDPNVTLNRIVITPAYGDEISMSTADDTINANGVATSGTANQKAATLASSVFFLGDYKTSGGSKVVASATADVSHTGVTTETTILTRTIPGGSIGPDGSFRFLLLWTATNNANVKTYRIKFNGTTVGTLALTSGVTFRHEMIVVNAHSVSSQLSMPATTGLAASPVQGGTSGTLVSTAINTAADITLTITAELATGTDTVTLKYLQMVATY